MQLETPAEVNDTEASVPPTPFVRFNANVPMESVLTNTEAERIVQG